MYRASLNYYRYAIRKYFNLKGSRWKNTTIVLFITIQFQFIGLLRETLKLFFYTLFAFIHYFSFSLTDCNNEMKTIHVQSIGRCNILQHDKGFIIDRLSYNNSNDYSC